MRNLIWESIVAAYFWPWIFENSYNLHQRGLWNSALIKSNNYRKFEKFFSWIPHIYVYTYLLFFRNVTSRELYVNKTPLKSINYKLLSLINTVYFTPSTSNLFYLCLCLPFSHTVNMTSKKLFINRSDPSSFIKFN